MIDHTRSVSVGMIYILGTWLSIDEMMARFMGRSIETYRMKNKPISEGFKFFVLTTSSGYVINFTPDGRTAAVKNEQEYDQTKGGKVVCLISDILVMIKHIQEEQDARNISQRLRCHQPEHSFYHKKIEQSKFCIAMDNFLPFQA